MKERVAPEVAGRGVHRVAQVHPDQLALLTPRHMVGDPADPDAHLEHAPMPDRSRRQVEHEVHTPVGVLRRHVPVRLPVPLVVEPLRREGAEDVLLARHRRFGGQRDAGQLATEPLAELAGELLRHPGPESQHPGYAAVDRVGDPSAAIDQHAGPHIDLEQLGRDPHRLRPGPMVGFEREAHVVPGHQLERRPIERTDQELCESLPHATS